MAEPIPARFDELAAHAGAAFLRHGWPKQREESWRYTSLRHLRGTESGPAGGTLEVAGDKSATALTSTGSAGLNRDQQALPASFAALGLGGDPALAFDATLIDGHLHPVGAGANAWRGLGEALADAGTTDAFGPPVGVAGTTGSDHAVVARNTALFFEGCTADRGASVRVRGKLDDPLRLGVGAASNARVAIALEPHAEAVIVELHGVGDGDPAPHLPVTEVRLGAGARLRHIVVLCGGPATTQLHTVAVQVGPSPTYELHALLLGRQTTR